MKLTRTHLTFYFERRGGLPSWAKQFAPTLISVHHLIPTGQPYKQGLDAHNALHLIRLKMKNGETLREALASTAESTWAQHNTPRRVAFARKWLRTIERRDPIRCSEPNQMLTKELP